MGKKRIVAKTEEELIKEKEKVEQAVKKEIKKEVSFRLEKGKIFIRSLYENNPFIYYTYFFKYVCR